MTIQFRRDLFELLTALRALLEECDRQGVDSTGYVHYIEAFKVDQTRTPYAMMMRHLDEYGRKHGDFRYMEVPNGPTGE